MPAAVAEPPKKHYIDEMDMTHEEASLLNSPVLSRVYSEVTDPRACIFRDCSSDDCRNDCSAECGSNYCGSDCSKEDGCFHVAWG